MDREPSTFDPLAGYGATGGGGGGGAPRSTRPEPSATRSDQSRASNPGGERRRSDRHNVTSRDERPPGMSSSRESAARRRRGGGEAETSSQVPLSAPRDPEQFETEEEWRRYHEKEQEGFWHTFPLVLVALPPLGAIVHGRAENWSDGIILLLVCLYLYQIVKVPWGIYHASRSRRTFDGALSAGDPEFDDPITAIRRHHAVRSLRRNELLALAFTVAAPALGAYLLNYAKSLLSDPDRYINRSLISLFIFAASIQPLLHFCKLVKNNSLYYQEAVWYPSADVHLLRRRVESLERELSQLTRAFATKDDVRNLRDGVDIPLSQLSKAVRRFDRKEEYLRLSSEERFALLDARLEEAQRDAATNAQLIDQLREEHQRFSNPITSLIHVIGAVLGHRYGGKDHQRELRWFERGPFWLLLWPVNVSTLAIEWVSKSDLAVEDSPSHSTPGKVTMIS